MNSEDFRRLKVGDRVKAKPGTFLDAIGTITEIGTGTENLFGWDRRGIRFAVVLLPSGNEVVTWDDTDKHRAEWERWEEGNGIEACRVCGGTEADDDGLCVNRECEKGVTA